MDDTESARSSARMTLTFQVGDALHDVNTRIPMSLAPVGLAFQVGSPALAHTLPT